MSNFLAIATVTATLQSLLQEVAEGIISGADAVIGHPEDVLNGKGKQPTVGINIFMYQVVPNPTWRNEDLPTRRTDGSLVQRPQAALNLRYLLTFFGNEAQLEPQRLLGSTVNVLHAQPLLTRARILSTIETAVNSDSGHFLGDSDLAEQVETIKFTPLSLSLEELSNLWSIFFQTPYALSVAYQASVVLIESQQTPQRALPVRARHVKAVSFRQPVIESVQPSDGEGEPILAGSTLIIHGQRLRGEITRVQVSHFEVQPAHEDILDTAIRFPLPVEVRAGIQRVQVLHFIKLGEPPEDHAGFESNAYPIVVQPEITINQASVTDKQVPVSFSPPVGKRQRVLLMLNEFDPPESRAPYAYIFYAPADNGISDPTMEETSAITFQISGVEPGDYLARVQVDGAESPLARETDETSENFNMYIDPVVTIP